MDNFRYSTTTTSSGQVVTTRSTWNVIWNISKRIEFSLSLMGWTRATSNFSSFDASSKQTNILFGKQFGSFYGPHLVTVEWDSTPGSSTFNFYTRLKLRNGEKFEKLVMGVPDSSNIKFVITDWDTHFCIDAITSTLSKTVQFDKNGENTYNWTGGSIIEPKWNITSVKPKYLYTYINLV